MPPAGAFTRRTDRTTGSVPDLVVVPADADDLAAAVALTAAAGAPVTMRGGGTSMAGNAIGGVVIDASRHVNRILDIDADARTAVVEPGLVLTDLLAAARPHRPDVRRRPVLGQPGDARRHDREQRLRRTFGRVGHHRRQRALARRDARRRHPLHRRLDAGPGTNWRAGPAAKASCTGRCRPSSTRTSW